MTTTLFINRVHGQILKFSKNGISRFGVLLLEEFKALNYYWFIRIQFIEMLLLYPASMTQRFFIYLLASLLASSLLTGFFKMSEDELKKLWIRDWNVQIFTESEGS